MKFEDRAMKTITLTIGDRVFTFDVNAEMMSWQLFAESIGTWAKAMALVSLAPERTDQ